MAKTKTRNHAHKRISEAIKSEEIEFLRDMYDRGVYPELLRSNKAELSRYSKEILGRAEKLFNKSPDSAEIIADLIFKIAKNTTNTKLGSVMASSDVCIDIVTSSTN